MKKVLILCTGNSCRSQIAHGWLQKMAGDRLAVFSAGIEAHGVNPRAIAVMAEAGVDLSGHQSTLVQEYEGIEFDVVLTVCDHAAERCPVFPGRSLKIHQNFPDPAKAQGTEEEIMDEFRKVRELIRQWCQNLLSGPLAA